VLLSSAACPILCPVLSKISASDIAATHPSFHSSRPATIPPNLTSALNLSHASAIESTQRDSCRLVRHAFLATSQDDTRFLSTLSLWPSIPVMRQYTTMPASSYSHTLLALLDVSQRSSSFTGELPVAASTIGIFWYQVASAWDPSESGACTSLAIGQSRF